MSGTSPVFIKQLLPAVILTAAGALVLGHLSQPVSTPTVLPGETAVNAEAIFTSTPRQQAEEPKPAAATRAVSKPKTVATAAAPTRLPEASPMRQTEVGPPLSIAPTTDQVQATAADMSVMGRVRSIGSTVQQIPQRTYSTVAGWFSSSSVPAPDGPPRPPADIPQNLKAAM